MRLQASLDSACINLMSLSVKTFYFFHRSERRLQLTFEQLLIPQGVSFYSWAWRPSWHWLWCVLSPWRSCDRSRHSCYPLKVTLGPWSVFQFCSPEFQHHSTIQLPYRAPSVQTSRPTSQYLPPSVNRNPTSVRLARGSTALTTVFDDQLPDMAACRTHTSLL